MIESGKASSGSRPYLLRYSSASRSGDSTEWRIKEMPGNRDFERFQNGRTSMPPTSRRPEGRLRFAVRLAGLGLFVTLLDASLPMLDFAKRAAREAGVTEKIALKHGDAIQLTKFRAGSFDVILCHNILEYVDDPGAVLCAATRALRDPSSIISVLVRNQAGEVLKAAITRRRLGRDRA